MRPFPPWLAAGIGLLVGVVLVMLLLRVPPPRSAAPSAPSLPEPAPAPAPPPFEAFEEAPRQGMPARAPRTGIALIVDDLGNNRREAIAVAELPGRFAASVLPDAPQARFAARTLAAAGKIVMLHLPMEPKVAKYRARMDGFFLTLADDDAAIAEKLARALAVVPEAQGVNNHMGSALTERWAPMRALMRGIAGRRLFFVDSLTSPRSVAADAAAEAGVPWAQRTLFLDHDPRPAAIKRQWAEALRCAEKALCVVIAHPHPETLAFLRRTLAEAPLVAITEALHPGAYALASHAR